MVRLHLENTICVKRAKISDDINVWVDNTDSKPAEKKPKMDL